jgi:hypothetical protein
MARRAPTETAGRAFRRTFFVGANYVRPPISPAQSAAKNLPSPLAGEGRGRGGIPENQTNERDSFVGANCVRPPACVFVCAPHAARGPEPILNAVAGAPSPRPSPARGGRGTVRRASVLASPGGIRENSICGASRRAMDGRASPNLRA